MPKPQYTYLRVNRLTKIRHQARVTKEQVVPANLSAIASEFQRMLARNQVDIPEIRRLVHDLQTGKLEPTGDRERRIKTLMEVIEKLDDLADELASHGELSTQLGGPARQFMFKVNGADLDGVGFAQGLLAISVFLAILERAYHNYRSKR